MTTTTSTADTDVHGPVDFVLFEFPTGQLTGEVAPALVDLVERGVIRLLDLLVISKADDGSVAALELGDAGGAGAAFFAVDGARSGLLGDDDMHEAAQAMLPGTSPSLSSTRTPGRSPSWAPSSTAAASSSPVPGWPHRT